MKAYSPDLRLKILAAVDVNRSTSAVARDFGVGLSTVKRYVRQRHTTGSIAPRTAPGASPLIPPPHYPALIEQLTAHPDATLDEHSTLWQQTHGITVSSSTMSRIVGRVGWTRKKRR